MALMKNGDTIILKDKTAPTYALGIVQRTASSTAEPTVDIYTIAGEDRSESVTLSRRQLVDVLLCF